jgi:hypothetical protein
MGMTKKTLPMSTPNSNAANKLMLKKIQVLDKYLNNPSTFYTGLTLKKYIQNNVFTAYNLKLSAGFNSGRFSAYAHNAVLPSFTNLLEKLKLNKENNILVHPLLSADLYSLVERTGATLSTLDVDKNTLNFGTNFFKLQLQKSQMSKSKIDTVFFVCYSGLVDEINAQIELCNKQHIKTVVIFPVGAINSQTLTVLENIESGGVIFNGGEDFTFNHLQNVVLDKDLFPRKIIYSLVIEDRISSILEYHLKDSQDVYLQLIDSYYMLLRKKTKAVSFQNVLSNIMSNLLANDLGEIRKNIAANKIDWEVVRKTLITSYAKASKLALPDVLFEIEMIDPTVNKNGGEFSIAKRELHTLENIKKYNEKFTDLLNTRVQGTIEIPAFYKTKLYTNYFAYSTEPDYIKTFFHVELEQQNLHVGFNSSSSIYKLGNNNLPNTKFINDYGVIMEC